MTTAELRELATARVAGIVPAYCRCDDERDPRTRPTTGRCGTRPLRFGSLVVHVCVACGGRTRPEWS